MSKQKTLNALAVLQATEDALKLSYESGDPYSFEEHFLKGLGKSLKKVGKEIKKVGKKLVEGIKKVGGVVLLAPLLPMKFAMSKALKSKGVEPPKDLGKLASKFYQVVIQKKTNFEYDYDLEANVENVDPVITPMIITAIVGFIKDLLNKKSQGKELSAEEKEITEAVETQTAELTAAATSDAGITDRSGDATATGGGGGFDFGKFLPIILVAVVLLFALKK